MWRYRPSVRVHLGPRTPYVHMIYHMISEVGGVSPTGKSFRVVRACARSGCLVRTRQNVDREPFPFSLFAPAGVPFSLLGMGGVPFSLVGPSESK